MSDVNYMSPQGFVMLVKQWLQGFTVITMHVGNLLNHPQSMGTATYFVLIIGFLYHDRLYSQQEYTVDST